MISPEAKKQLEEKLHAYEGELPISNFTGTEKSIYWRGVQAAWELATLAERERCLEILKVLPNKWLKGDVAAMIYGSGQKAGIDRVNPQGSEKEE